MGIYIWGTGCGASEFIEAGFEVERITAFIDSYPMGDAFLGKPVILPEALDKDDCELLVITTHHVNEISEKCANLGIEREKLFFIKNNYGLFDRNAHCAAAEQLLGRELIKKLLPEGHIVKSSPALRNTAFTPVELSSDYVRLASLELICKRLENIPGAAAELGVYRGHFAKYINRLLPERKLYLFDSFEGFEDSAGAAESFQAAHRNTAADKVLSLMPNPENVSLKPGFFPASLGGLEEEFCLVSLDVDFYETTLEGLRYFWPRLSKGGYILLHDWANPTLPQVAAALEQYERELGEKIPSVPICDLNGTLVLTKT